MNLSYIRIYVLAPMYVCMYVQMYIHRDILGTAKFMYVYICIICIPCSVCTYHISYVYYYVCILYNLYVCMTYHMSYALQVFEVDSEIAELLPHNPILFFQPLVLFLQASDDDSFRILEWW